METIMPEPVPLSDAAPLSDTRLPPSRFLIGKDRRGRWVARDERGLCGGLFVNRVEAVRFAMHETGRCPQAVILVEGILELNMASRTGDQPIHRAAEVRAA